MKTFKSLQDLKQLEPDDPAHDVVMNHLLRMSDLYPGNGYLILAEEGDTEKPLTLPEVQCSWLDFVNLSEGCIKRDGHFCLTYLTNNEYGIDLILPDAPWLDDELRKTLEENAEKSSSYKKQARTQKEVKP